MLAAAVVLQLLTSGGLGHAPGGVPGWALPDVPSLAVSRVQPGAVAPAS